jgi:hypothetical protein
MRRLGVADASSAMEMKGRLVGREGCMGCRGEDWVLQITKGH